MRRASRRDDLGDLIVEQKVKLADIARRRCWQACPQDAAACELLSIWCWAAKLYVQLQRRDCALVSRSADHQCSTVRPKPRSDATMSDVVARGCMWLHVPIGRPICRTIGFMFWTVVLSLCRAGLSGELYIAGVGSGAGLSAPFGSDGGAVCRRPAWRVPGQPDVPDRGPGAVAVGRGAGVSGAGGRAGEAARVPDRAWRDRGCAAAAGGGVAGGGGGARRTGRGGAAAGRLCGWRRSGRGARTSAALRAALCAAAAGPHGAVGARGAGSAAADAERQARPPGAACAGAWRRRMRIVRRARRRRRSCAGCLPRCWGSSGSASTTTSLSWAATASCRSSW